MKPGKRLAIILAAGEGKRMGMPKALLDSGDGRSFLQRLAETFAEAGCEVLAVVGAEEERVRRGHPEVAAVLNPNWRGGQFTSVKVGLHAAIGRGAEIIFVHPVDIPFVAAATAAVLADGLGSGDAAVPVFESEPGHPLVLSAAGAKAVLGSEAPHLEAALAGLRVHRLEVDDAAAVRDVDTPEEYRRLVGTDPRLAAGCY